MADTNTTETRGAPCWRAEPLPDGGAYWAVMTPITSADGVRYGFPTTQEMRSFPGRRNRPETDAAAA